MPSPVLITGGAGFLGRHLAVSLADAGARVTVLDDFSADGSRLDMRSLTRPEIRLIEGSTNDRALLQRLLSEHKWVAHLASVVGVEHTMVHATQTMRNLAGTIELAEMLTPEHVLLFGSSADVYGMHSRLHDRPMREDDPVIYESANADRWVYARVKSLEETAFTRSAASAVVTRIFNAYGPGMDAGTPKRLVPSLVRALLRREPLRISGNGAQRRSLCFVDDTVRGLVLALEHASRQRAPHHCTVNIGSTDTHSVRSVADTLVEIAIANRIIDRPPALQFGARIYSIAFDDTWDRIPDVDRARTLLAFSPRVPLADGMRRTLLGELQLQS